MGSGAGNLVGLGIGLDLGDGDTTVGVGVDVDHLGVGETRVLVGVDVQQVSLLISECSIILDNDKGQVWIGDKTMDIEPVVRFIQHNPLVVLALP